MENRVRRTGVSVGQHALVMAVLAFASMQALAQTAPAAQVAPTAKSSAAAPRVSLTTSEGTIVLELNESRAPVTVRNFLEYVRKGHYDGTIFHRVIGDFMIQGGGMTPDMKERSTGKPIENEARNGLRNDRGTVAMARTNVVNSATAQFFINVVNNDMLNHMASPPPGVPREQVFGYAVFGKVVSGMDVVERIRSVPTGSAGPHRNVPLKPVLIQKATILPAS